MGPGREGGPLHGGKGPTLSTCWWVFLLCPGEGVVALSLALPTPCSRGPTVGPVTGRREQAQKYGLPRRPWDSVRAWGSVCARAVVRLRVWGPGLGPQCEVGGGERSSGQS